MRVSFSAMVLCFVFAILALPSAAIAQVQINQKFLEQGPAPSTGPFCVIGTGDAPPQGITCPVNPDQNPSLYGTNIGAVQAVAPDPFDSNTIYVGAVNGGVWVTRDGGANWTHLTDNEVSLSITSLVLDPTDHTRQTLLAGTGLALNNTIGSFSNQDSFFLGSGGLRNGLLYSQDGGVTWTNVGADTISNSVVAAAAVGQTLLAGTSEISPFAPRTFEGGLYSSTDSAHKIWTQIKPNGVDGPVTSIALDPLHPQTVYVALTAHSDNPDDLKTTAIYISNDAGATWSPNPIFDADISNGIINDTDQTVIKLATAPNASRSGTTIAAAVINLSSGTLTSLFYSDDGGQSWRQTAIPFPEDLNPEMAAPRNFAITIDPSNPQFVYISGDEEECPFGNNAPNSDQCSYSSPVFRIDANSNTVISVNDQNTQNGSAVHADSRSLAVLPNGDLILVGDGGVYVRTQPQTNAGIWKGLNNLSAYNSFAVGYDAVGKRLITAAQDSGVTIQSTQNSVNWNAVVNFDGINAFVNDVTLASQGLSVFYATSQGLGTPTRIILDEQGRILDEQGNFVPLSAAQITCEAGLGGCFFGAKVTCNGGKECYDEVDGTYFSSPWINNRNDPTLMALGGLRVYITQDTLTDQNATTVDLKLVGLPPPFDTNINSNHVGVTAMAYGTRDNQNVLLAGVTDIKSYTDEGELWLSTTAAGAMERLGAYEGQAPTGIVFDQRSQDRFYVADSVTLWGTKDQGSTIDELLLPPNLIRPTSVEFINNNGVDALLVGGLSQTANAQSPIAVADSNKDGDLTDLRLFGSGLPNVQVSQISYNPLADVLAVGTFGRGVWTLYDVTSYFPQATALQFGLADNDSVPDASYLTDGTALNGTTFVRPLNKYGLGTLTIAGDASYTGGTNIFDGILQLGTGGTSGSVLGDVSFCSDATDPLCNPTANKFLVFDRSDIYSFDGMISGPGQLVQSGFGTTILTAASTYTGPTRVNKGALFVNGSITSSVGVNFGGLLGGGGSVGATTVGYGGTFAPGNSIGTLTVNGNLTLYPGALYEVEANAQGQSDKVIVKGTVNLTGATLYALAAGGAYKPKTDYVIIDNDGSDAVNGTFGQVANTLAFLIPSVIYDGGTGNDVVLTLERNSTLFSDVANTRNQRAVAGALDRFPTDDPLFLTVLNQTEQGARQAFDALSGEIHATVAGTLADDSRYVRDAVLGRLMQANSTGGNAQMAALAAAGPQVASINANTMALGYDDKSLGAPPAPEPLAFWTRAYGAWANFNGDGNAATADRNLGGFVSGMDAQVSGSWRVGLATGASFSNVNVDARYSSADTETYTLGGYLGGMASVFALRGGGMWAWSNIDTSRAVIFPGFFERQKASYDADTGQLFGEVAYPTQMWGMALEPFAGLAYVSVDADNFHERGRALASLRGRSTGENVGYTTVGLRAAQTMHWQSMVVTPHISAAWQHALDDVTPGAALAFASTGIGFTVYGVPLAEDSALLDTGLDFTLGPRITAGLSYSGQFGDRITDNAVKGRFIWLF